MVVTQMNKDRRLASSEEGGEPAFIKRGVGPRLNDHPNAKEGLVRTLESGAWNRD